MKISPLLTQLNYARACGGQGKNNGAFSNVRGYVDMPFVIPDSFVGLWVPYLAFCASDNGGSLQSEIYLCPESERSNNNVTVAPGTNGGGPVSTWFDTKWFQGVALPFIYQNQTVTGVKNFKSCNQKAIFVPRGFFLRVVSFNTVALAATVCFLEMYYAWVNDTCTELEL